MARKTKHPGQLMRERYSKNFCRRMSALNLDTTTLADRLGITRTDIWRYANGHSMPHWDRYAEISAALKVDPAYFLRDIAN